MRATVFSMRIARQDPVIWQLYTNVISSTGAIETSSFRSQFSLEFRQLWPFSASCLSAQRAQNVVIAAAAFVYITCVHFQVRLPSSVSRIVSKEFIVGVLFTAGCAAPVLSNMRWMHPLNLWPVLACVSFFAILAWLNCTAIQRWESGRDGFTIQTRASLICATGLVLALALYFIQARVSSLVSLGAASAMLLLLLDRSRHHLTPLLLRALADVVLLTPAVLLIFKEPLK